MNRRHLITGLVALIAAPAIVRVDALMRVSGERYFLWEYKCPCLPPVEAFQPGNEAVLQRFLGPTGRFYEGTWTFFGKRRNIYADEQIGFSKIEMTYPITEDYMRRAHAGPRQDAAWRESRA